jgi:16S rRNA C967 or C1407 C5-methylase (RsmB/RsmF family)
VCARWRVWQVRRFLSSEDGAEFELQVPTLDGTPLSPELLVEGVFVRLTPAQHGCDGFFSAVLRRKEGGWSRTKRTSRRRGGR